MKYSISNFQMGCERSSSSSSSSRRIRNYDVFLSRTFENSRLYFSGHLYSALVKRGLNVWISDSWFPSRRSSISSDLMKAIEESRILIVVFSSSYARSVWCLDELAQIAQCIDSVGQTVLPIFYNVSPSVVKEQRGLFYHYAFSFHEKKFKDDLDKVKRWRQAMTKVANLFGYDVRDELESEVIGTVVTRAMSILDHGDSIVASMVESRVKKLEKLMSLGSDVVRFIGICGMGGIGKSTLARALYDKISHRFHASCFLADVRRASTMPCGLSRLQAQLLNETLHQENMEINDVHEGALSISKKLRHLRTLIVLDDVDQLETLEVLVGKSIWFGTGSRIVITTRDENILRLHDVNHVYKVELLNKDEALQLFCRKAFNSDYPMRDYEELTYRVLEYTQGLPLAIESFGSFLCNRSPSEWESTLASQKHFPSNWILKVLQKSFDGLRDMEKEIFLDIACFFNGEKINYVEEILCHSGSHNEYAIRVLIDKSLLTISHESLQMHHMLQQLGREIIRQEAPTEPGKRSRLWFNDDFLEVMETNAGTEYVKAIVLNPENPQETPLRAEALTKMSSLRLLIIRNVNFSGVLNTLSNDLQYVSWHKFPFTSLPSSFESDKLVNLIMPYSSIKQLWEGFKTFPNLRSINLCGSTNLMKMPDFKGLPNLERLDLEGCIGLVKLDPSIVFLPNLKFLNFRNCNNLVSVPNNLFGCSSLEILNLAGCSKLAECLDFEDVSILQEIEKERADSSIQDPSNSDDECELENDGAPVNLDEKCQDDVVTQTIECIKCSEKLAIHIPNYKSKKQSCRSLMGDDGLQEMVENAKKKVKVHVVKAERYWERSTESSSSTVTPVQYPIAKCIVALDEIDGIPNDTYVKALGKFKDPDWREIFLTMSSNRKKAWLDSLL